MKNLVKGNCESCGENYTLKMIIDGNQTVICPHCKEVSDNWDTPKNSQFAPSIVKIVR